MRGIARATGSHLWIFQKLIDAHADQEDDHLAVDIRRHPLRDYLCHLSASDPRRAHFAFAARS